MNLIKSNRKTYSIAVIFIMLIINGCNPNTIPFKGKYENSNLEITSTKSIDSVWLHITQLFVEKGLVLKNIDKKKGLIVSKKNPFIPVYTFEDSEGELEESQAWVVLERVFMKKRQWIPKSIYGQWSIQITESENGSTTIKVDPIVICTYYPNMFTSIEARGQSTGKLEELIKSSLLNNVNFN